MTPRKVSTQWVQSPYEVTETVAACTGPAQVQSRQGPNIEKGKQTQGLTSNQEAIYNFTCQESVAWCIKMKQTNKTKQIMLSPAKHRPASFSNPAESPQPAFFFPLAKACPTKAVSASPELRIHTLHPGSGCCQIHSAPPNSYG